MKIVFSVFKELNIDGEKELVFEKTIESDLPIEKIDPLYNMVDGYSSYLFAGRTISFWEIEAYQNQERQIIDNINKIPQGKGFRYGKKEPCKILIDRYHDMEKESSPAPDLNHCYYYSVSKYERGASGLTGIVTAIYSDPILSGIISSLIAAAIIAIISKIKSLLKKKKESLPTNHSDTIYVNIRTLKQNFTKITSINSEDYQIIELKRKRNGNSFVKIKTIDKNEYEVLSSPSGTIISLDLSSIGKGDNHDQL